MSTVARDQIQLHVRVRVRAKVTTSALWKISSKNWDKNTNILYLMPVKKVLILKRCPTYVEMALCSYVFLPSKEAMMNEWIW